MKAVKEQHTEQQGRTNCRPCEVFQGRKYKLLCPLGEKNTRFVDSRALSAECAAISSHESLSFTKPIAWMTAEGFLGISASVFGPDSY